MTSLSAVVMAHRDAAQVRRLVGALEDVPIVLHCDVKAPDAEAGEMLRGWDSRVRALPRTSGSLDSWSLVRIELDGLRAALAHSAAEQIAVLSGADYPLLGIDRIADALAPWRGRSYLASRPLPYDGWNTPRHPDGGLWRTSHHFLTRGDDIRFVRRVPLRLPWRRQVPEGLNLRASAQWKVYAREDVTRLLAAVEARPDLVRFWRSSLVPDESFAASMLSSPAVVGGQALPDCHGLPWLTVWSRAGDHHPQVLRSGDFDAVAAAVARPPGRPETLRDPQAAAPQALFARKVSSTDSAELLDRIDSELRGGDHSRHG